ncbi:permease [Devosia pacifica]|uniref:Probable membrane transporter protein n=1 Tax=Devosia pacifica TaxID=1335967 RepID=A0A918SB79_9HYPH|nr:TSUP family transporter [Devosia pacifica]GHA32165.1 permease [Devosia pacifica]
MNALLIFALAAAVFGTSTLSGIFGMAGGLVLLWILLLLLPVEAAIAVHGAIQVIANGARAVLAREHIAWKSLATIVCGLALAALVLLAVDYQPNVLVVYFVIGLMPALVWIPKHWLGLDAAKPHHALLCGFLSGGLNLTVGVSGPTTDVFFIRTEMDRRAVIATKAATQVVSHAAKVVFYAGAVASFDAAEWMAIAIAAPFAVAGTRLGAAILHRMSNLQFRFWTRWIVTAIGLVYLVQGILLVV